MSTCSLRGGRRAFAVQRVVGRVVGAETGRHLWVCKACGHQTAVTAGTVMHGTRTPLRTWFWAAYLVATHHPGISARQLQHQLGLSRFPAPHRRRHLRDEVKHTSCDCALVAESVRAVDRLVDLGEASVKPPSDAVAKQPGASRPACADRPLGDDAALLGGRVEDRRHLNHEALGIQSNFERRVVEGARRAPGHTGGDRLVRATVDANEMPAGAERQPVQIDRRVIGVRHSA